MSAISRSMETASSTSRCGTSGHSPSRNPAQVLADDLGIQTENTAKWLDTHERTGATFGKGQLLVVDEASLAGTLSLDRITALAAEAGAKVLLVGDHAQLQSVTAGGAFALLVNDRDDAPELVTLHRFTHAWEKTASLGLRHGRTDVIDTYAQHDRIRGGDTEEMIDAAYTAWRADTLAGRASILVTDSNESVHALNNRARADLILDGTVNAHREVELHDGTRAAAGDTVITRRNDRRLRAGHSWVRNGDRWTITEVRDDGSLTLHRAGKKRGASVVLPAEYAPEHVDLGYAVTSFRAQGVTVDSSHVLADASMTRETFYVAMTRGSEQNTSYVALDKPDPSHDGPHPGDDQETTARSVLVGVLQHVGAELTVLEWRIPRAATALLVGACLGLSGALLQTVTRNPLASPDLIGISGGAYTAVLIVVVLVGADWALIAPAALVGALLAAGVLFAVSGSQSQQGGSRFLLAGVALAALLGGINSWIVVSASLESAMAAATWGAGSLASSTWSTVTLSGTALALGAVLCSLAVRRLRVHALGDDLASSLGAAPRSLRIELIVIAVALAAIATAVCGPIGLLPLVAPPIARALSRTAETPLALSAMVAAALLAIADLMAQHVLPGGSPAGL